MDKVSIGKRIVEARQMLDLTQTEFGQILGVAKQTLANWEHGRSLPDIIMLSHIAATCGMKVDDFLNSPITDSGEGLTERERRIINKLRVSKASTQHAIEILLEIKKSLSSKVCNFF